MARKKRFLSWSELEELAKKLGEQVRSKARDVRYVYGIPRSGSVPAIILSHYLNLKFFSRVPEESSMQSMVLVIDGVTDTGKRFQEFENTKCKKASIFKTPWTSAKVDFWAEESSDYIVFPFELESLLRVELEKS